MLDSETTAERLAHEREKEYHCVLSHTSGFSK